MLIGGQRQILPSRSADHYSTNIEIYGFSSSLFSFLVITDVSITTGPLTTDGERHRGKLLEDLAARPASTLTSGIDHSQQPFTDIRPCMAGRWGGPGGPVGARGNPTVSAQ